MNAVAGQARIREAGMGDVDFIVEANARMAFETERKRLDGAMIELGVRAVLAAPARGFYLVAEQAAVSLGCLLVTREWSDWRNGDWWWLQSVHVLPEARRGGVFRALYAEVERRARATTGVVGLRLYVERDNRHAQATYASLGMQETAYRLFEAGMEGPAGP
jgi:GNAT superfamily N-acetyltransferase